MNCAKCKKEISSYFGTVEIKLCKECNSILGNLTSAEREDFFKDIKEGKEQASRQQPAFSTLQIPAKDIASKKVSPLIKIFYAIIIIGLLLFVCNTLCSSDEAGAKSMAEELINRKLKSPSEAVFITKDIVAQKGRNFLVHIVVDAPNSFGTKIRNSYLVFCKIKSNDIWNGPRGSYSENFGIQEVGDPPSSMEIESMKGFVPWDSDEERKKSESTNIPEQPSSSIDNKSSIINDSLLTAIRNRDVAGVRLLLSQGANPNYKNNSVENYPLFRAVLLGDTGIVNSLLKAGANPNNQDDYTKNTPLHEAAGDGADSIVVALLKSGANIEAKNTDGYTPIFMAATKGRDNTINLLFNLGANLDITDNNGTSITNIAKSMYHENTAQLLVELKNKPRQQGSIATDTTPKSAITPSKDILAPASDSMISTVNKLFMGTLDHKNFSLSDGTYEGKIGLFKNLSTDSLSGRYVEQVKKRGSTNLIRTYGNFYYSDAKLVLVLNRASLRIVWFIENIDSVGTISAHDSTNSENKIVLKVM